MGYDTFLTKYVDVKRHLGHCLCTTHHCAYCGKELKSRKDHDDWDETLYYYCDCEDAEKEYEIMSKIHDLESKLPKPKYVVEEEIREITW